MFQVRFISYSHQSFMIDFILEYYRILVEKAAKNVNALYLRTEHRTRKSVCFFAPPSFPYSNILKQTKKLDLARSTHLPASNEVNR